eukprot:1361406-Prymnesium_polylepis.2
MSPGNEVRLKSLRAAAQPVRGLWGMPEVHGLSWRASSLACRALLCELVAESPSKSNVNGCFTC